MKKTFITALSFMLIGLFASCTAKRGFVSSLTRADIGQVQQFEPLNYVGIIEKGNNIIYNDSLTEVAKTLFEKELSQSKTIPVKGNIVIEDSLVNKRVQNDMWKTTSTPKIFQSLPLSIPFLRHGTNASDL